MNNISQMFNLLKLFYDGGVYDELDLKIFVKAKKITKSEYYEITGVEYYD